MILWCNANITELTERIKGLVTEGGRGISYSQQNEESLLL